MTFKFKGEIYFISLFRSKRFYQLKKYLKNKSLNVKIIRALSVKNPKFNLQKSFFSYKKYKKFHSRMFPTDREIACSISHLNAIRKSDINQGLVICEDDARLLINEKLFTNILGSIEKISDYDIVLLGFSKSDYETEKYINLINPFFKIFTLPIKNHRYLVGERYNHTTSGAVGYFINKKGKEKILEIERNFRLADDWKILDDLGLRIGYLKPTVIIEDIDMNSSLNHKQYFIRPLKTNFFVINIILSLRRRILFCQRLVILILKKIF